LGFGVGSKAFVFFWVNLPRKEFGDGLLGGAGVGDLSEGEEFADEGVAFEIEEGAEVFWVGVENEVDEEPVETGWDIDGFAFRRHGEYCGMERGLGYNRDARERARMVRSSSSRATAGQ
jgi:hypothetical protein